MLGQGVLQKGNLLLGLLQFVFVFAHDFPQEKGARTYETAPELGIGNKPSTRRAERPDMPVRLWSKVEVWRFPKV
jgi:hypothetical protein